MPDLPGPCVFIEVCQRHAAFGSIERPETTVAKKLEGGSKAQSQRETCNHLLKYAKDRMVVYAMARTLTLFLQKVRESLGKGLAILAEDTLEGTHP